MSNFLGQK